MINKLKFLSKKYKDNCIIINWNNGNKIDMINSKIKQNKVIILIVPITFNFNNFVKNCISNSINVISWKINNKKDIEYLIIAK